MEFSITVQFGNQSHKIEWEKQFLVEDFIYIIDTVFELDNRIFFLSNENGIYKKLIN